MISDIEFYRLMPTVAQRIHYLIGESSTIATMKIHEIKGVRHRDEMDYTINVPYFEGYDTANIVQADGRWYQIVERAELTRDEKQVTFKLTFDPLMTYFEYEGTVDGLWKKLPYPHVKAKTGTVLDASNLIESRKEGLTTMKWQDTTVLPTVKKYDMVWVEITTSCSLLGSIDPDTMKITTVDNRTALEKSVAQQSAMFKYGFFALYNKSEYTPRIQICQYSMGPGFTLNEWWKNNNNLEQHEISIYPLFYPSIDDVINDPDEVLGIPTDAILDVSVTAWCPYKYYTYSKTESGVTYSYPMLYNPDQELFPYIIRNALIQTSPTQYGVTAKHPRHIAMYELGTPNEGYFPRDEWDDHTLKLDTEEYVCGEINLRDANGNVIANIPRDYFEYDDVQDKWVLDYKAQTFTDTTGLYTRVDIGKTIPHIITFPEGKLPFVGDAWEQYRVRDMAYDRQALADTKEQALLGAVAGIGDTAVNTATTLALSAVTAPLTGGLSLATAAPTLLSAGGSILSTGVNTYLSMRAADQEQAVTEARQKGAAGTGYNLGYGISYCDNAFDIGAGFVIMMPSRFDPVEAYAMGNYYGFNADVRDDVTLIDGYYEGVPVTGDDVTLPEEEFDRLTEMFLNGLRVKGV